MLLCAVYSNFCLFTKLIMQDCVKGVYICFNKNNTKMTQLDILNENPWPVLAFVVSIYATFKVVKYLIKRADYEPTEVAPRKQEPAPEPVEYFNDWAEHIAKETRKPKYYKGKAGALNGNAGKKKGGVK